MIVDIACSDRADFLRLQLRPPVRNNMFLRQHRHNLLSILLPLDNSLGHCMLCTRERLKLPQELGLLDSLISPLLRA